MSKFNTKELAAALGGKPIGTIKSDLSRGKLVRGTDGLIDTDDPVNKKYIDEKTEGKGLFLVDSKVANGDDSGTQPPTEKPLSDEQLQNKSLDLRKKIADAETKEAELDLKKIQLEKAAGNLLPVELVQKIMVINIQSVFKTFEGELENQASIYTEVFGGNREHLAKIIEMNRIVLAAAIKKASEDSMAEIEVAIREYQDTRNRGERK